MLKARHTPFVAVIWGKLLSTIIKSDINTFETANNIVTMTKREIFEEGKILIAQRDELRQQLPRLSDDCALANEIQTNINTEWCRLGEKMKNKSIYWRF